MQSIVLLSVCAVTLPKHGANEAMWDVEDEELLVAAKQHLETLSKRHSSVT